MDKRIDGMWNVHFCPLEGGVGSKLGKFWSSFVEWSLFCISGICMKSNYLNEVIASLKEKKKCSIWVLCQFLLQNFLQKKIIKGFQKDLKSSACVTNFVKLPSLWALVCTLAPFFVEKRDEILYVSEQQVVSFFSTKKRPKIL